MPQDLKKSDKALILNTHTDECDKQTNALRKSSRPPSLSWKHIDNNLDDDVYTITATDHTLPNSSLQIDSIDGFFNRKRGRPPKNRFVEVYKHAHPKPQAIFTSFKLEKRELMESVPPNDYSLSNCAQSSVDTSKGCECDKNYPKMNSEQKPVKENSTLRYNLFSRVNTISSTPHGDKIFRQHLLTIGEKEVNKSNLSVFINNSNLALPAQLLDYSAKQTNKYLSGDKDNDNKVPAISLAYDSAPQPKKPKLYETIDNVTVVRATGTFYPENCKGIDSSNFNEKSDDIVEEKQISLAGNEVVENVRLKDGIQINATDDLGPSSAACTIPTGYSSALPQIYNVLQMQQQLLAYYQRIVAMTAGLKQLGSSLGHSAAVTDLSCAQSSFTASGDTEMDFLGKKNLITIILNLQKQQPNKASRGNELTTASSTEARLRHTHRKSTAININNRPQNMKTSFDVSGASEQNETERTFQFARGRTPSGYLRFRFNEDCGYEKCGCRQHKSHFHCNRADCQYSFCDRTRFVQHTARHERLDMLIGTDFQQYRTNMTCNYTNCPYAFNAEEDFNEIINSRKSSHFHCLICPFVCTDTNKVVAHRRLHSKMEFIRLAGFRKVSTKENCMISNAADGFKKVKEFKNQTPVEHLNNETTTPPCPYALRHVHYHCLVCNCGVVSRSQLLAHKHRGSITSTSVTRQQLLERVQTTTE